MISAQLKTRSQLWNVGSGTEELDDMIKGLHDQRDEIPKLTTLHEAKQSLDDVAAFLDYKGHISKATEVSCMTNMVAALHYTILSKPRQTTLDFFHE